MPDSTIAKRDAAPASLFDPPQPGDDGQALVIGNLLLKIRHARSLYFDDYAATDGGFSILLDMYLDTARGRRTSIEQVVAAADAPLSTALNILNILIDAGRVRQVGPIGQESYMLTTNTERAMQRYLAHSVDMVRKVGAIAIEPHSAASVPG